MGLSASQHPSLTHLTTQILPLGIFCTNCFLFKDHGSNFRNSGSDETTT